MKRLLLLPLALLLIASCKKTDDQKAGTGSGAVVPYFKPGQGVKHLHTITTDDPGAQLLPFNSLDLSVDGDGKIHWCIERGFPYAPGTGKKPTRYMLDPSSGDTLPVTGQDPSTMVSNYQWGTGLFRNSDDPDRLRYKPYTGALYLSYQSGYNTFSLAGDVPPSDYTDGTFIRQPLLYANGDVGMSFFEQTSNSTTSTFSRITTRLWHKGQKITGAGKARQMATAGSNTKPDSLWHGSIGFPAGPNGETLAATFDAYSLYLIDTGGTFVHTVPFKGQPFKKNSAANGANIEWKVKTSPDMSKTVLFCRDEDRVNSFEGFHYSTFFVDNATKTIRVGVNGVRVKEPTAMDFDMDGNIYYATCAGCSADGTTSIIKLTPDGSLVTVASNFMGGELVRALYARAGRIYLTVTSYMQADDGRIFDRISLFVVE